MTFGIGEQIFATVNVFGVGPPMNPTCGPLNMEEMFEWLWVPLSLQFVIVAALLVRATALAKKQLIPLYLYLLASLVPFWSEFLSRVSLSVCVRVCALLFFAQVDADSPFLFRAVRLCVCVRRAQSCTRWRKH